MQQIIIGAGLAGLLAACAFPDAEIHEATDTRTQHRALLRFRDESVSRLTGIPFRAVSVDKAVFSHGKLRDHVTIADQNRYARKVTNKVIGRSIKSLDRVTRYVAPMDFHAQLVARFRDRIREWSPVTHVPRRSANSNVLINTAPLPDALRWCGIETPSEMSFERSPVRVQRYQIPDCDVFQTIYFPDEDTNVFRASITGDVLIIESMADASNYERTLGAQEGEVFRAFGIDHLIGGSSSYPIIHAPDLGSVEQQYGKILDLPQADREALLHKLTEEYGVYSVGRFATWRNILLDDVVKDIGFVERLVRASDYGRNLLRHQNNDVPF